MTIYELFETIAQECGQQGFRYLNNYVTKDQYVQLDDKDTFILIANILSFTIDYKDKAASFKPGYEWEDGRTSFAPDEITGSDLEKLKQLDLFNLPLAVRARVTDVLWDMTRDYKMAQLAADSYFELFKELYDPEKWTACVNIIKRAVILASKVNYKNRLKDYLDYIYNCVISLDGGDTLFFSTQVIQLLIEQKYDYDHEKLLSIADNLIAGNKVNDIRLKDAYVTKENIYKQLGQSQNAKEVMISYARELIQLADKCDESTYNDIAIAERHIQEAIVVLRNNGQSTNEANKKLLAIQKKLVKGLTVHEFKMDVSDTVKMIKERYSVDYKECLLLLAADVPWMEVDKTKQEVIQKAVQHPLQNLFPATHINKDGNIISVIPTIDVINPEKDQDALFANMYIQAKQNEEMCAHLALGLILSIIRSKEEFTEESLDFIVNDNILIPEGRENIFRSGLYMGFSGRYYEAMHILAPQVENLFRKLAESCGDVVVIYDNNGIQQARPLGSIFERENLNLCYDENILFTFRGLMEKKEGSNLRNLVGHGLLDSNESVCSCIFFICAVYKLLFNNSKKALEMYNRAKKGKATQKNDSKTEYSINCNWDSEASVWVATSDTINGMVLEAEQLDNLINKVKEAVPELLQLNKQDPASRLDFKIGDRVVDCE